MSLVFWTVEKPCLPSSSIRKITKKLTDQEFEKNSDNQVCNKQKKFEKPGIKKSKDSEIKNSKKLKIRKIKYSKNSQPHFPLYPCGKAGSYGGLPTICFEVLRMKDFSHRFV